MSDDFDAARERLEELARTLALRAAGSQGHPYAEPRLQQESADIRLLLAEVGRLKAELDHAIRYGNAQRAIVVKLDAELAAEREKEHDVSHPGPCCVREIRQVDITGEALRPAAPDSTPSEHRRDCITQTEPTYACDCGSERP